jgi:hypothetical protein
VIVLSGLSLKNESKLVKEGAAGYLEKSDALFQNNSALLLQAIERVLADASNKRARQIEEPLNCVGRTV